MPSDFVNTDFVDPRIPDCANPVHIIAVEHRINPTFFEGRHGTLYAFYLQPIPIMGGVQRRIITLDLASVKLEGEETGGAVGGPPRSVKRGSPAG